MISYFIRYGADGPIKIGQVARAKGVYERLSELQCGAPEQLILLGLCDVQEKVLHERFRHLHKRGEWFEPGDLLLDYIRNNATQPPPRGKRIKDHGKTREDLLSEIYARFGMRLERL